MLLGFKKQFVPFIESGAKTHTIRAKRKIAPKVGETCHCYTGLRQKGARLLGRWPCRKVDEIRIWQDLGETHLPPGRSPMIANLVIDREAEEWPFNFQVTINGEDLDQSERDVLAWQDGFRGADPRNTKGCFEIMIGFWRKEHGKGRKLDFTGDMIHWEFKK